MTCVFLIKVVIEKLVGIKLFILVYSWRLHPHVCSLNKAEFLPAFLFNRRCVVQTTEGLFKNVALFYLLVSLRIILI